MKYKYSTQQLKELDELVRHRIKLNQSASHLDDIKLQQGFLWMLHEKICEELKRE